MIGDWMGSMYGVGGERVDWHLFLDHDGRYERTVRAEPDRERCDFGRWEYDEPNNTLRLTWEVPDQFNRRSESWSVLAVTTCEDSNVLLVLRAAVLASRNLPILLYRVHGNGRAYGTDWQKRSADRGDDQSESEP
jgi:hypothetical protein